MPFFSRVLFALFLVSPFLFKSYSQEFSTNRNPVGLEYNILFHADTQYTISQTGSATLEVPRLFDGTLVPSYTNTAPSDLDPTVILIEGLPDKHIQGGAWTGWTTRHWYPRRFKIEGYDAFNGLNSWKVFADYSSQDHGSNDFSVSVPAGSYTKLRFTFYEGSGTNGHMGISEIYFLHPEATSPYATLLSNGVSNLWNGDGTDISYTTGNVGIGVTNAAAKLDLNGTMRVREGTGVTDGDVQLFNHDGATYGFLIRPFDSSFNGGTWDWNKDFGYRSDTENWYVETGFGVGTTDVGTYKLAVNGNIRAKEINVETGWADYVFQEGYDLPSLEEVEHHIQTKGHLINIPSAKEVESNGIKLGEMNKLLLEKIEELTLYILGQEERLKALEEKDRWARKPSEPARQKAN